jgi:Pvc16 N-terminal domain/Carboxypeptidase regulatory-like domain
MRGAVVIRDLSLTLRAILNDPALATGFPELAATEISFDRPTDTFNPTVTTINLFLFDIRENAELKTNEPIAARTATGYTISRAPLRVACSYLVTAWPVGGGELALQEHRLLSEALQVLTRFQKIPPAFLQGKLVNAVPALPMLTAQSDGLREPIEFWTAIGNKLRPSIVVTATIAMDLEAPITAPEVVTSQLHFGERVPGEKVLAASAGPPVFSIGGRVSAAGKAVAGASVTIVEIGLAARTDAAGRYQVGSMSSGTYTVRVAAGATVKNVSVVVPRGAGSDYDVDL